MQAETKKAAVKITKVEGMKAPDKDTRTGWIDPLKSKRRHSIQRQLKILNVKSSKPSPEKRSAAKLPSLAFKIKTQKGATETKEITSKSQLRRAGNLSERLTQKEPLSPRKVNLSRMGASSKSKESSPLRSLSIKETSRPKRVLEGMAGVIKALADNIKLRVDRKLAEERFERSLTNVRNIRQEVIQEFESRKALDGKPQGSSRTLGTKSAERSLLRIKVQGRTGDRRVGHSRSVSSTGLCLGWSKRST